MMLDNVNPPNANYEQDFGVLEGTWSKVSATIEAMQAVPEGSWLWVLDTDIVIMDDTQPIDYIVNSHFEAYKQEALRFEQEYEEPDASWDKYEED